MEVWKTHPNYKSIYLFSNLGRVKRRTYTKEAVFKTGNKTMKTYREKILVGKKLSPKGYPRVNLQGKAVFVHSLICEIFKGKKPSRKHQVNHINGIKTDNRSENLEWVTNQENRDHAVENNLHPNRSNGFCIIAEDQIPEILEKRAQGLTYKEISEDYPVGAGAIGDIVRKYKDLDIRGPKSGKRVFIP